MGLYAEPYEGLFSELSGEILHNIESDPLLSADAKHAALTHRLNLAIEVFEISRRAYEDDVTMAFETGSIIGRKKRAQKAGQIWAPNVKQSGEILGSLSEGYLAFEARYFPNGGRDQDNPDPMKFIAGVGESRFAHNLPLWAMTIRDHSSPDTFDHEYSSGVLLATEVRLGSADPLPVDPFSPGDKFWDGHSTAFKHGYRSTMMRWGMGSFENRTFQPSREEHYLEQFKRMDEEA